MSHRLIGKAMTKKLTVKASFDENDIDDILENIEDLKELIDELKELRELQDERLQRNDKPIERPAPPKKS